MCSQGYLLQYMFLWQENVAVVYVRIKFIGNSAGFLSMHIGLQIGSSIQYQNITDLRNTESNDYHIKKRRYGPITV